MYSFNILVRPQYAKAAMLQIQAIDPECRSVIMRTNKYMTIHLETDLAPISVTCLDQIIGTNDEECIFNTQPICQTLEFIKKLDSIGYN